MGGGGNDRFAPNILPPPPPQDQRLCLIFRDPYMTWERIITWNGWKDIQAPQFQCVHIFIWKQTWKWSHYKIIFANINVGTSGHFFQLIQCAWFLHDLLEWIFIRILQFEFLKSATPFSSYRFLKSLNLPTFFPGVKSSILLFSLFYWWHRFVYPYMLCLWLITN